MKKIVIVFIVIFIMGCANLAYFTPSRMRFLHIGMTEGEVVGVLGNHDGIVSETEEVEYLKYQATDVDYDQYGNLTNIKIGKIYFVRFKHGKVESYGELGDFDSIKVPETKETIDLNIKI